MSTAPLPRMPAEWEPHDACWLAWPFRAEEWLGALPLAQREFIELCLAIDGERLEILVPDERAEARLAHALEGRDVRLHVTHYGDSWVRDTAPLFVAHPEGPRATCFAFNGWGGKYEMEGDREVRRFVAERSGVPPLVLPMVLEGGAIDVDGEGTLLTTQQCLLNPNRDLERGRVPSASDLEAALGPVLGVERVIWLDRGLLNDHTDGHVDTLARFVRPGVVVCMRAQDPSDPNHDALEAIAADLAQAVDARGRRLEVVRIPSPGIVPDRDGDPLPASYCNFYIANDSVVVPTYGSSWDEPAVAALASLFPGRKTVGRPARAILTGGGAFHCITQQQPRFS